MVKIFIDPGHGGKDAGATGNKLLEKDITLQLALAVRKQLDAHQNISINMSRTTDKTVSLTERTNMANNWGADFFFSIHVNAGGGTGFESYIYQGLKASGQTAQIRDVIHRHVMKVNGLKDRGKKQANFHVLRESRMPACLTENGFIDDENDAAKMREKTWINQVAKAYAAGIAEAFGLKKAMDASQSTEKYKVSRDVQGFYTAADARSHTDQRTTVKKGTYYVFNHSGGMVNVTKAKNVPGSWINPSDLNDGIHVGSRVKIKQSATHYATGEHIPSWVKGRTFTVQQVGAQRVLLKEIYSWLKKEDVV